MKSTKKFAKNLLEEIDFKSCGKTCQAFNNLINNNCSDVQFMTFMLVTLLRYKFCSKNAKCKRYHGVSRWVVYMRKAGPVEKQFKFVCLRKPL